MKIYVVIVLAILISIFELNRRVDVAGLDTYARVYDLSEAQKPDELLVWESLFDQRAWVKARLQTRACPEVFIIGSSTVGAMRAEWFGKASVLNAWMGAPTIEDFEAIAAVLEDAGCAPRRIIVGVDHWLLNAHFEDKRWTSLLSDYAAFHRRHGSLGRALEATTEAWQTFKERLNYVTTRSSVEMLLRHRREGTQRSWPRLVAQSPEAFCLTAKSEFYIRSDDGHYTGCASFANPPERVVSIARGYVAANTHHVRELDRVDPDRWSRLERVITLWKARGSEIALVAPPFHPFSYDALRGDEKLAPVFDDLDTRLTTLARSVGGIYFNLRDPHGVGCDASEFEDSHHGRPSCVRKVVGALTAR